MPFVLIVVILTALLISWLHWAVKHLALAVRSLIPPALSTQTSAQIIYAWDKLFVLCWDGYRGTVYVSSDMGQSWILLIDELRVR